MELALVSLRNYNFSDSLESAREFEGAKELKDKYNNLQIEFYSFFQTYLVSVLPTDSAFVNTQLVSFTRFFAKETLRIAKAIEVKATPI
jgi:hypothetical protein